MFFSPKLKYGYVRRVFRRRANYLKLWKNHTVRFDLSFLSTLGSDIVTVPRYSWHTQVTIAVLNHVFADLGQNI